MQYLKHTQICTYVYVYSVYWCIKPVLNRPLWCPTEDVQSGVTMVCVRAFHWAPTYLRKRNCNGSRERVLGPWTNAPFKRSCALAIICIPLWERRGVEWGNNPVKHWPAVRIVGYPVTCWLVTPVMASSRTWARALLNEPNGHESPLPHPT